MSELHRDLLTTLDAIEILGPSRYRVLDYIRDVQASTPASRPSSPLLEAFADDLYARLYVRPHAAESPPADLAAGRDFLKALSAANSGQGGWEPGWVIGPQAGRDDKISVIREKVTFWAGRGDVRTAGGRFRPGAPCRVRVGKEFRNFLPGYYLAIGDHEPARIDAFRSSPLIRLYWHLTPEAAVDFIASVTGRLNAAGVPFRAKVLSDPQAYHRADAAVLYLDRTCYRRSGAALARIHAGLASHLRSDVPLFTRRLAEGLAQAEDPGNGLSFGQHLCRIIARAAWTSFQRRQTDRDQRAATLIAALRAAGLDPSRPHLRPRSRDSHALHLALAVQSRAPA